jgi:5-formaminoimidazole-4-carboxamide-1-(beta)-D-ribofuranosyl 5'-monophosphate synthetase
MKYSIVTFASHSALQILHGAKQEGFHTIALTIQGTEQPYKSFKVADEIITIKSYADFFAIEPELTNKKGILIPHASLIAYLGIDAIKRIKMAYFGDRTILSVEADRDAQMAWLSEAGLHVPKTFNTPETMDRPCIIKFHGADGGRGYFLAKNQQEFYEKIGTNPLKKYVIQEYVVGVPIYIHYFYSPLTDEIELMGFDRRYESNVDGIGRIAFKDQMGFAFETSYTVAGNTPLVLRESLLPAVFQMGAATVKASRIRANQGLYGPFCLETMVTPDLNFCVFEISARIVAGTNVYVSHNPYSYLRYNEPMSTGRRIAREIKTAIEQNQLEKILG